MRILNRLRDDGTDPACRCEVAIRPPPADDPERRGTLVVDADDCPGDGALADSPDCRARVIDALADRGVDAVHVTRGGRERVYDDDAVGVLVAAGRFAARVAVHDETLAERARRDPLGAARAATGRAGPVSDLAAATGLAAGADRVNGDEAAFGSTVGPTISDARLERSPPNGSALVARRELETGATVRRYRTDAGSYYLLDPLESQLDSAALDVLASAHDRLAHESGTGGDTRAIARAVRDADASGA